MGKAERIVLYCNHAPVSPTCPARLRPGRANQLAVVLPSILTNQVIVRFEVKAPNGKVRSRVVVPTGAKAELQLGPLCSPAVYEYEHGMVFRRGYSCQVTIEQAREQAVIGRFSLAAICSREGDVEWWSLGAADRCIYNDGYIPEGGTRPIGSARAAWNPFGDSAGAMQPPLQLRLAPAVLQDQDRVVLCYRTRPEPAVGAIRGKLRICNEHGQEMISSVTIDADGDWRQWPLTVDDWPVGNYSIELLPWLDGDLWEDGPTLPYRRGKKDPEQLRISPYAPFTLQRDSSRPAREIKTSSASLPEGWEITRSKDGEILFSNGDPQTSSVRLEPGVDGFYAVFAETVNSMLMKIGGEDIIRKVNQPELADFGPVFVAATDMTGQTIELFANDLEGLRKKLNEPAIDSPRMKRIVGGSLAQAEIRSGIKKLRLVPVTRDSVEEFYDQAANPPHELCGVDDWWCYFRGWDRTGKGQLDTIMKGQREVGINTLNWAVGRSWVQYPSKCSRARIFPCAPVTDELLESSHPHFVAWERIVSECDCLEYPLNRRDKHGLRIQGWLAMNRHYSPHGHGGVFTSDWARKNAKYNQHLKNGGGIDVSRMEYFFPEVRSERLDILEEVAGYNPDGIVIGCCRQPPIGGYNPELVKAYKMKTGIDPTMIDIEDGQPYLDWLSWRAGFFTDMLRELALRLRQIEAESNRRIPVTARIPGVGLAWNLAQGLDVKTWIAEGLIDLIQLDPLQSFASGEPASHDVRPYLALGRQYGVPVFGGVNGSTGANCGVSEQDNSPLPGLLRALGLWRAGVDGIEIYEAEVFAASCERRWLISLWGHPELTGKWLREANLEAVFPITARNAALGHDNHWFGGETMHGTHTMPRGAERPL